MVNNKYFILLGTSYLELMRRGSLIGPHILVIRDSNDVIFGAYLTESWKKLKNVYLNFSIPFF